tara:strand:- start:1759 stop:2190 length:432 start_codon:yes stop_codon:yes gene_type:complete
MNEVIVTDIDTDNLFSNDEYTEIYSILEANNEQFLSLWKKTHELQHILTTIQSELENTTCDFNCFHSDSEEHKERYNQLLKKIKSQDDNLEIEFTNVYKQIKNNEEVTTYIIMILTCILVSVMVHQYDLSEYSKFFDVNTSTF